MELTKDGCGMPKIDLRDSLYRIQSHEEEMRPVAHGGGITRRTGRQNQAWTEPLEAHSLASAE
jgi:hypothetical protein